MTLPWSSGSRIKTANQVLAQEEARTSNHTYIDTEHLLLGVVREVTGLERIERRLADDGGA